MMNGTSYPIMESFYTLQGEGAHSGKAAFFIRLGGCDVGCVWCDVKESWDRNAHPERRVGDLVTEANLFPARLAVITGGEPLIHNLNPLTLALKKAGFRTHLETSGSSPLSGNWDWICLSPKKFKAPLPEVFSCADELKIVVFNAHDFKWALSMQVLVKPDCRLFVQPEWSKSAEMTPLVIEFVMKNPHWQISLQSNKYIGIP